jgi:hypothetical protein
VKVARGGQAKRVHARKNTEGDNESANPGADVDFDWRRDYFFSWSKTNVLFNGVIYLQSIGACSYDTR